MNAHVNGTGLGRPTCMSFKPLPARAVRLFRSRVAVSGAATVPLADQQASGGGDSQPPRSRPPSPFGGGGDYGEYGDYQGRKPSYDFGWVQSAGAATAIFASCVAGVLVLVNMMLEPIRVQMTSTSANISIQFANISTQITNISVQINNISARLDDVAKEVNNLSREVARLQVKVDKK